jgi:Holliday junction resolvase
MSLNRFAVRRDANEGEIVAALEAIGCDVVRADVVDLIVGRGNLTMLIECKDGSKPPSARKLTPSQLKLQANWRGHYAVVTSPEEAIAVVTKHTTKVGI